MVVNIKCICWVMTIAKLVVKLAAKLVAVCVPVGVLGASLYSGGSVFWWWCFVPGVRVCRGKGKNSCAPHLHLRTVAMVNIVDT